MGRKRKEVTLKDLTRTIIIKVPVEVFEKIEQEGVPSKVVLNLLLSKYDN